MRSNTALAISGEQRFLRRMVTGLTAAGGVVRGVETLQEAYPHLPDTSLVYYHAHDLPDDNLPKLAAILKGGRRLAVLVPRPGIRDMLAPLSLEQVTSVAAVGAADGATLAAIASRSFYGNIFGLERYLPYGVRAHATLIGDSHEKAVALSTLASFARTMHVRRKYTDNIERVADELLMNALYNAPLAATRAGLVEPGAAAEIMEGSRYPQDRLVLQYACDGELFALGVTDHYGAMPKSALLQYVERCLGAARPFTQETGSGAGLGLYLVCSSVSQLIFNISPGVATEVIALFNLRAPKLRLTHISFLSEEADVSRVPALASGPRNPARDAAGARASMPSALSATSVAMKLVLAGTALLLLAVGGLVLWDRLAPRGRGREQAQGLPAALRILSSPPGAEVRVEGVRRGQTPVLLGDLAPGSRVRVALSRPGFQPLHRVVTAPAAGVTDARLFVLQRAPR